MTRAIATGWHYRPPKREDLEERATQVAAVIAHDGVRFTTAAPTRDALNQALAEYVSERAPEQLWPTDAEAVREFLSLGDQRAAIDCYFAAVGDRWDEEWLVITDVE